MMLRPKSRGYLKLHSKNPFRHPLIYHNYLTHPDDVAVLREGVKGRYYVYYQHQRELKTFVPFEKFKAFFFTIIQNSHNTHI